MKMPKNTSNDTLKDFSKYSEEQLIELIRGAKKGVPILEIVNPSWSPLTIQAFCRGYLAGEDSVKYFTKSGSDYNFSQLLHIVEGLEEGLDVSLYDDPKFNAFQMMAIHDGLKAGLDVTIYAKPEYSAEQMLQICEDLKSGIDISTYINP